MIYNDINFFKVIISLTFTFLSISNPYNSKIGIKFLTYLATFIVYTCFTISKNYLITVILVFLVTVLFIYLDTIAKKVTSQVKWQSRFIFLCFKFS